MFRTADPSTRRRKKICSLVLLAIAVCLVAHFLIEDISLQRAAKTFPLGQSNAGLAFDVMEHQDDLALTASLPGSIPHTNPPPVTAWGIRLEQQFVFPIRIPPKIA